MQILSNRFVFIFWIRISSEVNLIRKKSFSVNKYNKFKAVIFLFPFMNRVNVFEGKPLLSKQKSFSKEKKQRDWNYSKNIKWQSSGVFYNFFSLFVFLFILVSLWEVHFVSVLFFVFFRFCFLLFFFSPLYFFFTFLFILYISTTN